MSTYTLEELLRQWMNEELTADQAMGHFLQHLLLLQQQVQQIERSLAIAAAGIPVHRDDASPPAPPTKRK